MALALGWAWTNSATGHGLCKGPEVRVTPRQVNAHLSELRRSPWGLGVCSDPRAPWVPRLRLPSLCTSLSLGKNVDVRQATGTGFQHEKKRQILGSPPCDTEWTPLSPVLWPEIQPGVAALTSPGARPSRGPSRD